jgi:hypothetical protein
LFESESFFEAILQEYLVETFGRGLLVPPAAGLAAVGTRFARDVHG